MAVAPSTCRASTSAFCWISVRRAALSPFMAASATSLRPAAQKVIVAIENNSSAKAARNVFRIMSAVISLELREPVGAVALFIPMDAIHIEDAQQQVSGCDGFSLEVNMASAFELSVDTANEVVRHIVMLMLIRVAHVGAMQNQCVIQQRSIS